MSRLIAPIAVIFASGPFFYPVAREVKPGAAQTA